MEMEFYGQIVYRGDKRGQGTCQREQKYLCYSIACNQLAQSCNNDLIKNCPEFAHNTQKPKQ